MIELPETYVLADQINQTLTGKTVRSAVAGAHPHGFAWYSGDPAGYNDKLAGRTITGSNPGTGYTCGGNTEIFFGDMLMVLSTPIKYHAPGDKLPAKHQLLLTFEDDSHMSCTVQMWGAMFCYEPEKDGPPNEYKTKKGPTPLAGAFDEPYFMSLVKDAKPSLSAKAFLATDQRIPGLGNGVLQDILFNARIHPKRKIETFGGDEWDSMYKSVKETLADMMLQGGRDTEKDLFGANGGYKTILSSRTLAKPCPRCGSEIVRETFLGGKIYYCPSCQGA